MAHRVNLLDMAPHVCLMDFGIAVPMAPSFFHHARVAEMKNVGGCSEQSILAMLFVEPRRQLATGKPRASPSTSRTTQGIASAAGSSGPLIPTNCQVNDGMSSALGKATSLARVNHFGVGSGSPGCQDWALSLPTSLLHVTVLAARMLFTPTQLCGQLVPALPRQATAVAGTS